MKNVKKIHKNDKRVHTHTHKWQNTHGAVNHHFLVTVRRPITDHEAGKN